MLARMNDRLLEILVTNDVPEKLYRVFILPRNVELPKAFFAEQFNYGINQVVDMGMPILSEISYNESRNLLEGVVRSDRP